jgi:hypothetical protein
MLPRVDNTIRPVAAVSAVEAHTVVGSIADSRHEALDRIARLGVGKHIQAEVISKLNDGSFIVKLGGASARMSLPENVKTGDALSLTLIALNPRPTFELDNAQTKSAATAYFLSSSDETNDSDTASTQAGTGSKTAATNGANNTSALQKTARYEDHANQSATIAANTDPSSASTETKLSTAGKLIDLILHTPTNALNAQATAKAALINSNNALPPTPQLAQKLEQSIQQSGIFYESHVADWAQGKLPLAQLMLEPQANIAKAANVEQLPNSSQALQTTMNQALAPIVQAQLNTLEQQQILWHGQFMPNVPLEWKIEQKHSEQGQQDQQSSSEQTPAWQSTLNLHFPELGHIAATIQLHGEHLQLTLQANTAASANALQDHARELSSNLNDAGSPASPITIKFAIKLADT